MNTILIELTRRETELVLLGINMAADSAKAMVEEAGGPQKAPIALLVGVTTLLVDAQGVRAKLLKAIQEKIKRGESSVEQN